MLARTVDPETLDGLAATDPAAQRSRRDLRWIHRAMGTRAIVRQALRDITAARVPSRRCASWNSAPATAA
jgi:hypothetical protein